MTARPEIARAALVVGLLLAGPLAAAEDSDEDEDTLPPAILGAVRSREKQAAAVRIEGINLLQDFLRDSPVSDETAEALYKLAELLWEEAQTDYLDRMGRYQQQVAACKRDRSECPKLPKRQPTLDLSRAQSVYQRLIRDFPGFRKIDTVLYLYAFSLREQGKADEAAVYFQRILEKFPRSRFRADAWMAVGEWRFYEKQDFPGALSAYERVIKHPRSQLAGLALFKTAWCYWKLGKSDKAALRFKDVLDLGKKAQGRSVEEQKRAAELQDQALDYLVELFTEDDTKTAEDAYAFLSQIGGKAYSQRVLRRFADTVYDQTRYERAAQAYIFLIAQEPKHADAPTFQQRVVESFQALGKNDRAAAEMRRLAVNYGPKSEWAHANADRPKVIAAARAVAEEFIRKQAKSLHAIAQRNEKESKVVDRDTYAHAAEGYEFYLAQFPDAQDAVELRYLRADILYFKIKDMRGSGSEYLLVGRSQPVGKYHREALLQAMNAFEKLRPAAPAAAAGRKKREVTDDDRRFAEAADLYAVRFPNDKEIITVIYKNGQFFYDYGDYDEAIKRFGLIIEKYPDHPTAGAAGDRLLECLGEAKDYENIETWGRRLKGTKAFAGRKEQERLDGLIAGAMMKSGEKYVAKEQYDKAAEFFQRAARDYPALPSAATALNNAGAAHEKAGKPDAAVAAYKGLADRYPRAAEAPEALFVAARIEESIAAYPLAAALYEQLAKGYPQSQHAPAALRNAGLLRQTLGQHDRAIAHYADYEKQFKGRPETRQVAFQRALVFVERKDAKGAAAAFADFHKAYPTDTRAVEALVREAEAELKLGNDGRAREALQRALALHRSLRKPEDTAAAAAEARYLQGELAFRDYDRIKIAGRPKQLQRALEDKAKFLDDARKVYLDVLTFRVPEWATAALLRIGQGYSVFAKALRNAKVPRELSAEEQQIYRDELEKNVVIIEEKALDAYKSGYAKALDIGVYNKHTRSLRQALAELEQGEFPKEAEARLGPQLGEGKAGLDVIEEIRRD